MKYMLPPFDEDELAAADVLADAILRATGKQLIGNAYMLLQKLEQAKEIKPSKKKKSVKDVKPGT